MGVAVAKPLEVPQSGAFPSESGVFSWAFSVFAWALSY